ncbi:MAG: hypothetical protein ABSF47_04070 [Minisyncoccia bacterium]|jgi:hypothetical protein
MISWNVIWELLPQLLFTWFISFVIAIVVTSARFRRNEPTFPGWSFLKIAGVSMVGGILGTLIGNSIRISMRTPTDPIELVTDSTSVVLTLTGCFVFSFLATALALDRFAKIPPKKSKGKFVCQP